ncbi:MAG TPA: response regulator [Candidatus Angelobacter sp.]|jgi:CheY-like chemotaxis protein|nr:response regulator [Candidatus Angelobacter sp.]
MRVGEVIADDSAAWAAPLQRPISSWFPDPTATASNVAPALSAAFMEGPTRAGKEPVHVLLIEDDPAIAEMYRIQLEYDGFRVTEATTGAIGYRNLVASRPDIVLLDLLLPDRSGFEIMADIKEQLPSHPPVVILSNYGEPAMMDRGFSLGALEYLVKSRVTPASVSQSIRGWIEQARRGSKAQN